MITDLGVFWAYHSVEKLWGSELWLTNTPLYCAKFLTIDPGMMCSKHRHLRKTESFFVMEGSPMIQVGDGPWEAKIPGDMVHLPAGTWHRFAAVDSPAILLEISTEHSDEDVERREPSGYFLPF